MRRLAFLFFVSTLSTLAHEGIVPEAGFTGYRQLAKPSFNPQTFNVPQLLAGGSNGFQVQTQAPGNSCVVPMPGPKADKNIDPKVLMSIPPSSIDRMPKLHGLEVCKNGR